MNYKDKNKLRENALPRQISHLYYVFLAPNTKNENKKGANFA